MIRGAVLLRRGIARYAVRDLAPTALERDGFRGGARWMARAMGTTLDDSRVERAARLGMLKYGASLGTAVLAATIACRLHVIAGAFAFVLAFYAVEVQGLFLVPLVVRGEARPFARSRALMLSAGGTARAVAAVLPIAAWMIFAGLRRGFARAWCEGCLAVVAWFEELEGARDA